MEPAQPRRVKVVQLDDDFFRAAEKCRRGADRRGEHDLPVRRDVARLNDRPVNLAEESAAHLLGQVRKVHVEEAGLSGIDAFAQRFVALIGCAPGNCVGPGQFAVEGIAGGGACDNGDLEWPACGVFSAARAASAFGVTFAAPAAVKPLNPIV